MQRWLGRARSQMGGFLASLDWMRRSAPNIVRWDLLAGAHTPGGLSVQEQRPLTQLPDAHSPADAQGDPLALAAVLKTESLSRLIQLPLEISAL